MTDEVEITLNQDELTNLCAAIACLIENCSKVDNFEELQEILELGIKLKQFRSEEE